MNAHELFERHFSEFYDDTGYLAPGKDAAAEDFKNHDYLLRRALWQAWLAGRTRGLDDARSELDPITPPPGR